MTKPPPWTDTDAVISWAYAEFDEAQSETERQGDMWQAEHAHLLPGFPTSEFFEGMERQAVSRAEGGDFSALAHLLEPVHPFNETPVGRPIRDRLKPETWWLIADRLSGELKTKRGRPKMTADKRRFRSPIHDAAEEVGAIRAILKRGYPKQGRKQIRDMALVAVGRRHAVKTETIAKYLGRPTTDRRRPR
jgi:hypothetical protein